MAKTAYKNIGFKGGVYNAMAKGHNCLAFVPRKTNNKFCVVNIGGEDNMNLNVFDSGYGTIQYTNLESYTSLIIPYPKLSSDTSFNYNIMARQISIQLTGGKLDVLKLDFSNVQVDDTLKIVGKVAQRCKLTLPSENKPQYLSLIQLRGTSTGEYSTLDLRDYVCYSFKELLYSDIKIGIMGSPLKNDNVAVYIEGLDNVTEFGGLQSDVDYVYIIYCGDETILTILNGIDGTNGPNGYVNVRISLRDGQTITDEMRNIATQNSISLD